TAAALLFVAFAIKAGAFPLNFWMAPAYPMASFVTGAVFAGLLTKVGVYAMLRVFAGPLAKYQEVFGPILITMGALTMVVGVLAAMSQMRLRRVLSFHILSQIGYMLVGVGLFTASSLAAAIYYTIHHILVKTNLFLVAGMMVQAGGSEDLTKVGGLLRRKPLLALLFVVPALSLAGIPPFSGFFAKFFLIDALLEDQRVCLAILAAAVSLLTLYSMTKMWDRSFWEKPVVDGCLLPIARRKVLAVGLLSVLTVIVSLAIEPALALADHIAAQLVPVEKPL
ncbi:MAG: multicomponent Na+:H+ antiporter subunit D, partial [Rhodothermales bacterium]